MGLDINAVQFLIDSRKKGIEFGEVVTLGRQDLNVYPSKLIQVLGSHGYPTQAFQGDMKALFAEPLFLSLGARKVHSLDFSNFEGATFTHDLNQPIGDPLRERFDLVYDGGTLEHVFNFPVALKNCMEMVRPGGWLFLHTIANNYCGHGFYQFSPELFFRAFSPENGFEIDRVVVHRVGPYGPWHEVNDPEQIRSRVEAITWYPLQMLVRARRVRVTPDLRQHSSTERLHAEVGRQAVGCERGPCRISHQPLCAFAALAGPHLSRDRPVAPRDSDWFFDLQKPVPLESKMFPQSETALAACQKTMKPGKWSAEDRSHLRPIDRPSPVCRLSTLDPRRSTP